MRYLIAVFVVVCASCQGPGILQPQMKPANGSYEKPFVSIGAKPQDVWTGTTLEAGVNNKPLDGKVITIVGEVIDLSCYLQLGKHGQAHKECAQKCMRNGVPIALLDKSGEIYIVIEEEHHPRRDSKTNLREKLIEHAADVIEVTGTLTTVGSLKAIFVQGYIKK